MLNSSTSASSIGGNTYNFLQSIASDSFVNALFMDEMISIETEDPLADLNETSVAAVVRSRILFKHVASSRYFSTIFYIAKNHKYAE